MSLLRMQPWQRGKKCKVLLEFGGWARGLDLAHRASHGKREFGHTSKAKGVGANQQHRGTITAIEGDPTYVAYCKLCHLGEMN